jgi:hypothetical protein
VKEELASGDPALARVPTHIPMDEGGCRLVRPLLTSLAERVKRIQTSADL